MLHFVCSPFSWADHLSVLDFFWNEETGEVSGKSAEAVRRWAELGGTYVATHPEPSSHQLSSEPLKNRTDMAALIGYWYELPEELKGYYPMIEDEEAMDDASFKVF